MGFHFYSFWIRIELNTTCPKKEKKIKEIWVNNLPLNLHLTCFPHSLYADEFHVEKSPMKFLVEEMSAGNSLKNTICLGNEKERERVYDTIFHLPWRCELVCKSNDAKKQLNMKSCHIKVIIVSVLLSNLFALNCQGRSNSSNIFLAYNL